MRRLVLALVASTLGLNAQQPLVEGSAASRVRVVVFEDLQCSDCAAYQRMLDEALLKRFGGQVAFEHRDFPLPSHRWARQAAVAARFFQTIKPALGGEFRRQCLANRKQITPENFKERLAAFARAHGVDPDRAAAALEEARYAAEVEKDYQEGIARGVARTPTVFVNGQPFIESFTLEEISKAIESELKAQ